MRSKVKAKSKVKWRVLIFPGGTEVGMEIARSLRYCKEILLYSASSAVTNHAPYFYNDHSVMRNINDNNWIDDLSKVIDKKKIDIIFPANSLVIDALLKNKNHKIFKKCKVAIAPGEAVRITRSKLKTYEILKKLLPTPKIYKKLSEIKSYPVFVKPDAMYGEQGAEIIRSKAELQAVLKRNDKLIMQEYLPGKEYTVDCFSDRHGRLKFCSGRERNRIRMGTSMHGVIADNNLQKKFKKFAESIQSKIPMQGGWFFQMKEDKNGNLKLLEVEARIAGTMALNRARGINFPLLTLFDLAGIDIDILEPHENVIIDRALVSHYQHKIKFSHVYVDLDDTLIIHGKVNTQLVAFLYQCINKGIRVTLISKSLEKNRDKYLEDRRLYGIFDEIIWQHESESKADMIKPKGAIFIDDSFSQRMEVAERHNIPTFDPSMVEMLIDERI